MNNCFFLGKFTRDPELRTITKNDGGTTYACNFTLSVARKFKKANGELGRQVSLIDCEIYDSAASLLCERFRKDDPIIVQASVRNDHYVTKDGNKVNKIKFRVESFSFLPYQSNHNYNNDNEEIQ